ncbi:MAG TPA: extracellular solute-binding protein [Bacilli bacterium]
MLKKWLITTISLVLVLAMLAGCGADNGKPAASDSNSGTDNDKVAAQTGGGSKESSAPAEKVKLKFFTGKVETVDLMNQLIDKFNSTHPNIQVEQEYQKDASNVIKVKFASGDIPDITTVVMQDYIDQGKYLDLSNEPFWSNILPSVKELCTDIKTGKQFKVATNVTMAGIFYNKDIFNELGLKEALTWDDFYNNLKVIKEKKPDVVPLFLPGKESWTLGHLVEFIAHGVIKQKYGITDSRKAFIFNEQDKLAFDAPNGSMESFASRLLQLKKDGLINSDALTATYDNQKQAFVSGKAAMISQGMWVMGDLLKMDPNFASKIGFSPYPPIIDGTKPVVLSAEDSVYAITSASKHPKEALEFLNFLFQPENLQAYSEFLKSPPAFTNVDADWGPIKDEAKAALSKGANIQFTDWPSGFSGDDAGRVVQELLADKYKTPAEFAKAFKESWDKAWNATNGK